MSPTTRYATMCEAFQETAAAHPDRVALRTPGDGIRVTWAEYGARVRATAGRLAGLGVGRGDTVGLLLTNRPEAAWVDVAAMHLGATVVSLYAAAPTTTHAYVLQDIEARVLVFEPALGAGVGALRRACPALAHAVTLDELDALPEAPGFDFEAAWRATRPDDVATLLFTSGTTGAPKGVVWPHGAMLRTSAVIDAGLAPTQALATVAQIPFAHAGHRAMAHYRALVHGSTITYCADPRALPAAVADAHPTCLFAAPGSWQQLQHAAQTACAEDPETAAALRRAIAAVRAARAGTGATAPAPPADDARRLTALRAAVGLDRLEHAIVSAAPSAPELHEAMQGLGLPFFELYASSEVPPITTSRPVPDDIGTVGRPLPGVAVRIADDGEILVRHPGQPPGYHRRPAQTAALLDGDGWAHTGDLGTLDPAGRLRLGGRRDERFANAFGHNIDPARIEAGLRAECPLIAQACVIGDRRPHLVALLTLAPGFEDADGAVDAAVARANAKLPEPGRIQRFQVLEDTWDPGGDEVTPTLKLRRGAIHSRYADAIEALYA